MVSTKRYERAERFLEQNIDSLILNNRVEINWTDDGEQFWYQRESDDGSTFVMVDPQSGTQNPAFDHQRLAESLTQEVSESFDRWNLPFDEFSYANSSEAIRFEIGEDQYHCDLDSYVCERVAETESPAAESPDGRWVAYTDDYDLYVRNTQTQEIVQLTSDGEQRYSYGTATPSPKKRVEKGSQIVGDRVNVQWSPDSKKLMTYRLDQRSANQFTLVQSSPNDRKRPKEFTYDYPLPGENGVPLAEPLVFDVEKRKIVPLDIDPIPCLYFESGPLFDWHADSERLHYVRHSRGFESATYFEVDAVVGESTAVINEKSDTLVDPWMTQATPTNGGDKIIWTSERTGWNHLYLIDAKTGTVENRITEGEWVVRDIKHVHEDDREIFFTASGREPERDPYLRHLYRVNFDGTDLTLLTPEPADHSVSISPSGNYFVDSYSRVDDPPVTVVRDSTDGNVQFTLVEADVADLRDAGWQPPEPFETLADDGRTDIYGVMWYPSDFDPADEYPVVEYIYTGPHDQHVPKSFNAYQFGPQAIAELGFIVIMVDGRGTGRRSKEFRDYSYKNLAREGIEDHKAALKQLSEERSYINLDRVGVYGHSAGGYDSARALLQHSEFYDVAVSSSGNHDHRLDKASWTEMWMGYPVDEHYHDQSNVRIADQLEGKLLLVHGELDQNVHPASTLNLADALIDANKDFDMLILPNEHHWIGEHPYFIRSQWDYFVEHLLDREPPSEYEITTFQ